MDFGLQRFGIAYPNEHVIGSTNEQPLSSNTLYNALRGKLIQSAVNATETAFYNTLPQTELPTDIGNATGAESPSSLLRALGIIAPVADPTGEKANYGDPPSIGFNSAFNFDFDPSNGIASDKIDFDATAVHEMGHALGFVSNVGAKELSASAPLRPTVLDFFRFRPGITANTFTTTQRILSSGGTQIFFDGIQSLQLSTGKPDGTGGDGQQASHWKDDGQTGQYIGIMDPTLPRGRREEITANDLLAFELLGYRLRGNTQQQAEELKTDDGTPETGTLTNALIMVNRLTPSGYPSSLRTVRLYLRPAANQPDPSGQKIRLLAFNQPAGAIPPFSAPPLLLDQDVTIPTIQSSGGFVDFNITAPPSITSGDWYVGFQAPNPHNGIAFWFDTSGQQQQRGFFSLDNGVTYNGPFAIVTNTSTTPANIMIRAVVSGSGTTNAPSTPYRPPRSTSAASTSTKLPTAR